jgi:hypothetical protein
MVLGTRGREVVGIIRVVANGGRAEASGQDDEVQRWWWCNRSRDVQFSKSVRLRSSFSQSAGQASPDPPELN